MSRPSRASHRAESLRNAAEALQARVMVEMQRRAHRDDIADSKLRTKQPNRRALRCPPAHAKSSLSTRLRSTFTAPASPPPIGSTPPSPRPPIRRLSAAWSRGAIDKRKVHVIGDGLCGTDAVFADTVAAGAIDYATDAHRTAGSGAGWRGESSLPTRRQRRCAANARRPGAVSPLTPLPDGVAELSALMPAVQARQIYDTLNAIAHATDGDDARTLDQRRSDALYDLATGRAEPPQVHLNVTVPASVLAGDADEPALLAGYGPITASEAQALVAGPCETADQGAGTGAVVTWQRLLTDPTTGALTDLSPRYRPPIRVDRAVRLRDVTCRFPGCRRSASTPRNGVDLDHTVPWPAGSTSADNLACLCRHHHRVKHSPGWVVVLNSDGAMEWTTPGGRRFMTQPWQYDDPPPLE